MPKSECVAGGTKTESLPGAHPLSKPSSQPHPRRRSQSWHVCCSGNFRSVYGEMGGESLVLFPFSSRCYWTNVGAVVGDKVTRPIMTPIFVRETGCFKNSLNTMTCGTAREINSDLCGFFYLTYY